MLLCIASSHCFLAMPSIVCVWPRLFLGYLLYCYLCLILLAFGIYAVGISLTFCLCLVDLLHVFAFCPWPQFGFFCTALIKTCKCILPHTTFLTIIIFGMNVIIQLSCHHTVDDVTITARSFIFKSLQSKSSITEEKTTNTLHAVHVHSTRYENIFSSCEAPGCLHLSQNPLQKTKVWRKNRLASFSN